MRDLVWYTHTLKTHKLVSNGFRKEEDEEDDKWPILSNRSSIQEFGSHINHSIA